MMSCRRVARGIVWTCGRGACSVADDVGRGARLAEARGTPPGRCLEAIDRLQVENASRWAKALAGGGRAGRRRRTLTAAPTDGAVLVWCSFCNCPFRWPGVGWKPTAPGIRAQQAELRDPASREKERCVDDKRVGAGPRRGNISHRKGRQADAETSARRFVHRRRPLTVGPMTCLTVLRSRASAIPARGRAFEGCSPKRRRPVPAGAAIRREFLDTEGLPGPAPPNRPMRPRRNGVSSRHLMRSRRTHLGEGRRIRGSEVDGTGCSVTKGTRVVDRLAQKGNTPPNSVSLQRECSAMIRCEDVITRGGRRDPRATARTAAAEVMCTSRPGGWPSRCRNDMMAL